MVKALFYSLLLHALVLGSLIGIFSDKPSLTPSRSSSLRWGLDLVRVQSSKKAADTQVQAREKKEEAGQRSGLEDEGTSTPGDETLLSLRSQILEKLDYPLSLRRKGVTGSTTVRITLSWDGVLESIEVAEKSVSPELDQLAIEAVKKASPFNLSKSATKGKGRLSFSLPIEFRLE